MPVRIACDAFGLEGNWIDVAERWTQREIAELNAAADDAFFALLRRKAVACHVAVTPELTITDPAQLTAENMLDADVLLLGWLGRALPLAVAHQRVLGSRSARLSLPASVSPAV